MGVAAIPQLLEASPTAGVLVFTAYDTDERVVGAMRAGARGYLLKGAPADEIARAIRIAGRAVARTWSRGSRRPSYPSCAARHAGADAARARGAATWWPMACRTSRSRARSRLSERTVKFHVASLFRKLGADNRAQAVALGLQKKL